MTPEELVANVFDLSPGDVNDETSQEGLEEWDSLGHMNLVLELEQAYGVSLSTDEALEIKDVATLKRILKECGISW